MYLLVLLRKTLLFIIIKVMIKVMIMTLITTLIMTLIMTNNQGFHRKTNKYMNFLINTHYFIFRRLFCRTKTPGGAPEG